MRYVTLLVLLFVAFSLPANCQTRQVTLNWQDTANPSGTTYNVYRAAVACSPELTAFVRVNAAPVSAKTYVDQSVGIGNHCYRVTALNGGLESEPSNRAAAVVGPWPPGGLTITVQVTVTVP